MGSLFLELSKQRSLLKMMEEKGFTLCQQNGQRTYGGPPPNWGPRPPPSRDCEVFIGRLPRMCFEDELIPLFLTAGELYEFRLMLDFSGTNRGYGYAHYATLAGAQRAIEKLNKYEIRPGHQIGVLKSKNNCRLLFGNIGSALNVEAFSEFIRSATDQVLNVIMFRSFLQLKQTDFRISSEVEEAFLGRVPRNNGNNQFAIVEYENHKAAAVARRVLIPKYGHILAIDWAVPPRERKRFGPATDTPAVEFEGSVISPPIKETGLLTVAKSNSKVRPVPVLLVQPSQLDNLSFLPKTFNTVVKFFKYQLSVCLYKSVDQLEIPLYICKEIERKIVDRITNLENCSQAVQLIFNYFSWYNEKKRFIINSEVQKLLQEVKMYAETFLFFINKKLKDEPAENSSEENYYIKALPLQLCVLFRILLRSDGEYQAKLSSGITKGLKWLMEVTQNGGKASKEFIEEIVNLVQNEDGASLDKASSLAKTLFLNAITSYQRSQNIICNQVADLPLLNNSIGNGIDSSFTVPDIRIVGSPISVSGASAFQNFQHLEGDAGHYMPMPFSHIANIREEINMDSNAYPPVPLLLIQPSIMNRIPFMPDIFNNVLTFFKYIIRVCLNVSVYQMNIPPQVSCEIERKIIDRISNLENCIEGVSMIMNYFSWWVERKPCNINLEVHQLLQEVKTYCESYVTFVWSKTMSVYIPNEVAEENFCKILPLRLNILYQMMLMFNAENPVKAVVGINKGLDWLEDLIQNGGITAKQFLEELTRFIIEADPSAYVRAKNLGRVYCAELMNCNGRLLQGVFPTETPRKNPPTNSEITCGVSITGSDNASDSLDYDS